jgi:hypothetical protein
MREKIFFAGFEVLMVVNLSFKAMQFGESPMFGGTYCLHLQD